MLCNCYWVWYLVCNAVTVHSITYLYPYWMKAQSQGGCTSYIPSLTVVNLK